MSEIDITGIDKKQLLKELWKNSKTAGFFTMSGMPAPGCNDAEIDRVFSSQDCYADYLCGRVIKTSFKTNKLNPWGYDRDNGAGAMQKVVDAVRAGRSTSASTPVVATAAVLVEYSDEIEAKMPPMLTYEMVQAMISMNRSTADFASTDNLIKKRKEIAGAGA